MRHEIVILVVLFSMTFSCIGFAADSKSPPVGVYSLLLGTQGLTVVKPPVVVPRDEKYRPFKKKRFVPFSKQVEYIQIGPGYKDDTHNTLFVIDPLQYNFDPNDPGVELNISDNADDLIDMQPIDYFAESYNKTAASAMMDDDVQDETAVVCWPDSGPGTLLVINPKGDPEATTFDVETKNLSLDIGGHHNLAYDYDITSGDIDGDGYDEIIIAGSIAGTIASERLGKLWIVDDAKASYALIKDMIINGVFSTGTGYQGVDQLKVAAGNVDKDWADEIAIAFAALSRLPDYNDTGPIHYRVFDDFAGNFDELTESDTPRTTAKSIKKGMAGGSLRTQPSDPMVGEGNFLNYFNIAMGDMDRDGRDEIAIGIRSHSTAGSITPGNDPVYHEVEYINVEVVDDAIGVDGFALDDKDDLGDAFALLNSATRYRIYTLENYYFVDYLKFFDMVDIDGDRADEIFTGGDLYDDIASERPLGYLPDIPLSNGGPSASPENWEGFISWYKYPFMGGTFLGFKIDHVSFGDVNGDLREDITLLLNPNLNNNYPSSIQTIGYKDVITYDTDTGEKIITTKWMGGLTDHYGSRETIDSRGDNSTGLNTIILSANVDNDSTIMEYPADNPEATPIEIEESHTTYYSRNQIIAVLAAPPAIDNNNTDGTCTNFGLSSTDSFGVGAEASVRAGVLAGMEVEVQGGLFVSTTIAKVEAEIEAQIEVAASVNTSVSVTKSITYTTGDKEDLVIFSTTPYDRYQYMVSSHPNPEMLGKGMTIDVPQEPKVLSWTRKYYNDNNGDQLDIGKEILQHTPGDISTYLNKAQKDNILAQKELPGPSSVPLIDDGLWWLASQVTSLSEYGPHTVQQGSGSHTPELVLNKETVFEGSVTGSVDFMAKACGATICAGVTGGFSIGASSEYSMAEGITFSATVSAIQGDPWGLDNYDYGIFAYKQSLTDDVTKITHDFTVVNYWVE